MALRKTGKRGQIFIPLSDGNSYSNTALTAVASKSIGGVTYTDRFVGTAVRSMWNRAKPISATLQGIVGEAAIAPASGNDKVCTQAAISYFKDGAAGVQTAAIDADIAVTRPAGNVAKINAIVLDIDDGSISAVAGDDGSTTAFSDVYGAAGGPPLVAVDKIVIGWVKLVTSAAAPVTSDQITYINAAGTLIQERADVPSYEVCPVLGGILLGAALEKCHTGGIARRVYASYYDVAPVLAGIAHSTKWALTGTGGVVSMPGQGDTGTPSDASQSVGWAGSFERYYVGDAAMFKLAMQRRYGIVRLFPDRDVTTEYYEGAVIITGWGMGADQTAAMLEPITFTGDGTLEAVGLL